MSLQHSLMRIEELMAWFVIRVSGANAAGRTDLNTIAETLLIPLFAEVYNYRNLKNLNSEKINFPAIDLGDDDAKVAFQITARSDISKIRSTLQKFENFNLHQRYSTLYIYDLVNKQRKFRDNLRKTVEKDGYFFDRGSCVLDYHDVIREASGLSIEKVLKIQSILESYLEEKSARLRHDSDPSAPTELIDKNITNEVIRLRKSRLYPEFDGIGNALLLTEKLNEGDYRGGTASVRSWALVWCARTLAGRGELEKARKYLEQAARLGSDTRIANALICSEMGDKVSARKLLAGDDSSDSISATFNIIAKHDGQLSALNWLKDVGFGVNDLNSEGKFTLLRIQLELRQLEVALATANALSEKDLVEVPAIHHPIALSHLLGTVPVESRHTVLNQVPFGAARFPLASDSASIEARKVARQHFICGARAAEELGCRDRASTLRKYALWLELLDPEGSDRAKKFLEGKLRNPNPAPYLIALGLQFEIGLDLVAAEKEINRYVQFHGVGTPDVAEARLALALCQETLEDAANYVHRHYTALSEYYDSQELRSLQVEMFANAGLTDKAGELLEVLSAQGLSELDKNRLLAVVAKAKGMDTVAERERLFKQTNSRPDLEALVNELESEERWDTLCKYGSELFGRTSSLRDAERLANALLNANKANQVVAMLSSRKDFLAQSSVLKRAYCWALFFEGEFLEARREFETFDVEGVSDDYRALRVNISVALGDWNSLITYVSDEYRVRENRSAHDLIGTAQMAIQLNSPFTEQLISAAVSKASDDPVILASAFLLATEAGFEDDPKYSRWLIRAAELSGDKGPLVRMTSNELFDLKAKWNRQDSETYNRLNDGEIPMFFATNSMNRSLTDLMLLPAWANSSKSDIRYKIGVPAYSGSRDVVPFKLNGTIGLDVTTLLTLSFLNLLDCLICASESIYISHSTLMWLFGEKRRATFHQPNQIRDAEQISHLLTNKVLKQFSSSITVDRELAAQVGEELAAFIGEAQSSSADDSQHLVVRLSTIGKDSSLLAKDVDLTEYATVLSSCQAVVEKLRQMGKITAREKEQALAHLQLHKQPWQFQQEISDRAVLFFDDSAVILFHHLGLLEKLHSAGFNVVVSPGMVSEVRSLIAYKRFSSQVSDAIEHIRSAVNVGIESGKIKAGRISISDGWQKDSIPVPPTVGLLELANDCDVIIVDDRYLNQNPQVEHNYSCTQILSTLDLLNALATADFITVDDVFEYRTKLRHAGYFFVPIDEDELTSHLSAVTSTDYRLNESAELGAIRESILSVKMNNRRQLPKESKWAEIAEMAFVRALRTLWRPEIDFPSVIARSNWILDQLDIGNGDLVLRSGRGNLILALLVPPADTPQEIRKKYQDWAEEKILGPYKDRHPDLFAWILANYRSRISAYANQDQIDGINMADIPNGRTLAANAMLNIAPSVIREALLEDGQFLEELGLEVASFITFEDHGVSFQRSELYAGIRQRLSGASNLTVTDTDGRDWVLSDIGEDS